MSANAPSFAVALDAFAKELGFANFFDYAIHQTLLPMQETPVDPSYQQAQQSSYAFGHLGTTGLAASAANPTAPRKPLLEEFQDSMHVGATAVQDYAQRLHNIADRLIGSRPTAINKAQTNDVMPVPSTTLGMMAEKRRLHTIALDYLRDAVERLEAL